MIPLGPATGFLEATSSAATLLVGYGEGDDSGARPLLGRSRHGGAFGFNPFALYASGLVSSPNAMVLGRIGSGKSALVKAYVARMLAAGFPSLVIDPKGEYGALARHFEGSRITLMRGGQGVNPFVPPSVCDPSVALEINCEMAERAISCLLGRPASALEGAALGEVLADLEDKASFLSLRRGLAYMDERGGPREWLGAYRRGTLAEAVAALDRLLQSGMVSERADAGSLAAGLGVGIVVADLSSAFGTSLYALAVTMVLSSARALQMRVGAPRMVVAIDEIWALAEDVQTAGWLRGYWKLSRAMGIANVGVTHRLGDLTEARGGMTSTLLQDSETVVSFSMEQGEAASFCRERGIAPEVARLLSRLPKGSALWQVGSALRLIDHRLTPTEMLLCDTDARLLGGPSGALAMRGGDR